MAHGPPLRSAAASDRSGAWAAVAVDGTDRPLWVDLSGSLATRQTAVGVGHLPFGFRCRETPLFVETGSGHRLDSLTRRPAIEASEPAREAWGCRTGGCSGTLTTSASELRSASQTL